MKKIVLFVMVLFLGLIITGCGNSLKEYAGTYNLEYSKYVKDPDTAKNTSSYAAIILNSDGTGTSKRDGRTIDIEWSMDGENIILKEVTDDEVIEYNGSIKNGVLMLYDGDKTNSLTKERMYIKE